jgi:hypothetical protein
VVMSLTSPNFSLLFLFIPLLCLSLFIFLSIVLGFCDT